MVHFDTSCIIVVRAKFSETAEIISLAPDCRTQELTKVIQQGVKSPATLKNTWE
jgi:hypothetical protein